MFYTKKFISTHNTEEDCWLIANYTVYDVTEFLLSHPEHKNIVLPRAGTDVSKDYFFHTKKMKQIWNKYKIGYCLF